MKFEMLALNFSLEEGKLFLGQETISINNDFAKKNTFFESFVINSGNYFKKRLESSKAPLLRVRYFQILWNSKFKHHAYARGIIDSSLDILHSIDWNKRSYYSHNDDILFNAYYVSILTKFKPEEFENIRKTILQSQSTETQPLKRRVLKFMVENNKFFNEESFKDSMQICDEIFQYLIRRHDTTSGRYFRKIAEKCSSKIGVDPKVWYIQLGKIYEAHAQTRNDATFKMLMYQDAMTNYKLGCNPQEYERANTIYQKLKPKVRLSNLSIPMPIENYKIRIELNRNKINRILDLPSNAILEYLMLEKELIPPYQLFSSTNETGIFVFFQTSTFDANKNLGNFNDGLFPNIINRISYSHCLHTTTIPVLKSVFYEGIKLGKINIEAVLNFIRDSSWLGLNFERTTTTGENYSYNWVDMISPALRHFFNEMENFIKNEKQPNFVLTIDSLTLKFEGILRDLAQFSGVTITKNVKGDTRVKIVEDILRDKKLNSIFSESELAFFTYVFTKQGLNLRNNIAHAFYKHPSQYNSSSMYLVLLSLLKLGGIKFEKAQPTQ